jgi:hypothetical protein
MKKTSFIIHPSAFILSFGRDVKSADYDDAVDSSVGDGFLPFRTALVFGVSSTTSLSTTNSVMTRLC